ncbi:MAG: lipopolysaccharide transport periplasmic protein LptA [Gammaproteobacteria bacterium]|jgi:lipopolysaccharide export system protein LptA|nr:MAG: lipopolysaccharide transport periplasmic protein LptA [Gammaproteobacteria bacterium]
MYIPASVKTSFSYCLLGLSLGMTAPAAFALGTDQEQDIEIDARKWELDDRKNQTVYEGNVVVTRGSIRMTGDRMTVHYTDNEELDTLIVEGNPATYRQLPDGGKVYDEGRAQRMEFHEFDNLVILIEKAEVVQERSSFSGDRIEYDTKLSRIRATSAPASAADQTGADGRVKIVIKPRRQKTED